MNSIPDHVSTLHGTEIPGLISESYRASDAPEYVIAQVHDHLAEVVDTDTTYVVGEWDKGFVFQPVSRPVRTVVIDVQGIQVWSRLQDPIPADALTALPGAVNNFLGEVFGR